MGMLSLNQLMFKQERRRRRRVQARSKPPLSPSSLFYVMVMALTEIYCVYCVWCRLYCVFKKMFFLLWYILLERFVFTYCLPGRKSPFFPLFLSGVGI
jgi:hypothetical protein